MAPFSIDQQTLDDLRIFGRQADRSVYGLFNSTRTRGGAGVLEELICSPLSNAQAINHRGAVIRYFSGVESFPFTAESFDLVEQYLENTDERSKLPTNPGTALKRLIDLVTIDPQLQFVDTGVRACVSFLREAYLWVGEHEQQPSSPYREEWRNLKGLFVIDDIAQIVHIDAKERYAYEELTKLDLALRFRSRVVLLKMLRYFYEIDVYMTIGRVALERDLCYPQALEGVDRKLTIRALYHPHVLNAVVNDVDMSAEHNVLFLTGANMAGKSTFMKSLGIALYLAHIGFPVFAERMEFSVMDGLFTTINLPDNLGDGISHFYAEVLRIRKIAKELKVGKRLFVIVDELFRGTNVKDAYEATIAISTAFAKKKNSMFVISTHIMEAGEVLKESSLGVDFRFLPTEMKGTQPIYSYQLRQGITDDRHGMIIINNEGILNLLRKGKKEKK